MAVVFNRSGIRALRSIQKRAVERRLSMATVVDVKECRFCLSGQVEEEASNPMISPCACMGTQQYIHRDCLLRWTSSFPTNDRRNTHCGVCNTEYTVPVGGRPVLVSIHSSLIRQGNRAYTIMFVIYIVIVMVNLQMILWFIIDIVQSKLDSDWIHGGIAVSVLNGFITLCAPIRDSMRRLEYTPHGVEFISGSAVLITSVVAFLLRANAYVVILIVFISFGIALTTFIFALRRLRNIR